MKNSSKIKIYTIFCKKICIRVESGYIPEALGIVFGYIMGPYTCIIDFRGSWKSFSLFWHSGARGEANPLPKGGTSLRYRIYGENCPKIV